MLVFCGLKITYSSEHQLFVIGAAKFSQKTALETYNIQKNSEKVTSKDLQKGYVITIPDAHGRKVVE